MTTSPLLQLFPGASGFNTTLASQTLMGQTDMDRVASAMTALEVSALSHWPEKSLNATPGMTELLSAAQEFNALNCQGDLFSLDDAKARVAERVAKLSNNHWRYLLSPSPTGTEQKLIGLSNAYDAAQRQLRTKISDPTHIYTWNPILRGILLLCEEADILPADLISARADDLAKRVVAQGLQVTQAPPLNIRESTKPPLLPKIESRRFFVEGTPSDDAIEYLSGVSEMARIALMHTPLVRLLLSDELIAQHILLCRQMEKEGKLDHEIMTSFNSDSVTIYVTDRKGRVAVEKKPKKYDLRFSHSVRNHSNFLARVLRNNVYDRDQEYLGCAMQLLATLCHFSGCSATGYEGTHLAEIANSLRTTQAMPVRDDQLFQFTRILASNAPLLPLIRKRISTLLPSLLQERIGRTLRRQPELQEEIKFTSSTQGPMKTFLQYSALFPYIFNSASALERAQMMMELGGQPIETIDPNEQLRGNAQSVDEVLSHLVDPQNAVRPPCWNKTLKSVRWKGVDHLFMDDGVTLRHLKGNPIDLPEALKGSLIPAKDSEIEWHRRAVHNLQTLTDTKGATQTILAHLFQQRDEPNVWPLLQEAIHLAANLPEIQEASDDPSRQQFLLWLYSRIVPLMTHLAGLQRINQPTHAQIVSRFFGAKLGAQK